MPRMNASCLATSVLPTPVGPLNRNEPIGLSGRPRPERAILIAEASASIAGSWPKTTLFRSRSSVFSFERSSLDTEAGGMRAILATISSTSGRLIVFFCLLLGRMRCAAPASSITSIALSGRCRSLMNLAESSAAACSAAGAYLTLWCSSKRDFRPFRISIVCSTEGSTTSTFWKRRDSAASFSKMPRYSVKVVAPMHFIAPELSAGLSRLLASSVPPEAAPAPISVWISSMNRIAFGWSLRCLRTPFRRCSKSPRYLVPGKQRAHVERVDGGLGEDLGDFALGDPPGQPFGDRRLADAGLADQQRVVLAPAAQDLDHALDLVLAADQRIDLAVARELVEVLRELVERRALAVRLVLLAFGARAAALARLGRLGRIALLDAVGDEVDDVEARHALLVQVVHGVRILLAEDRDQHVGAGHFLLAVAGRLDVHDRALDDALEAQRRLGVDLVGAAARSACSP